MPKICILSDSFYPIIGGGETHARLLAEELIKKGVPVFVLTQRKVKESLPYELVGSVPVYRVSFAGFKRWGKYLMMVPAFCRLIMKRHDYDVIYVCGLRVLGVIGVCAAKVLQKKCVLRSESCDELRADNITKAPTFRKLRILQRLLEGGIALRNKILMHADVFVSISRVIQDEFLQCGVSPDKIRLIPNGVDTTKYHPVDDTRKAALREKYGFPAKRLFIYTGKLNKGKGLELLLRVWKKVVEENKSVCLLLAGSGEHQYLSCENQLRDYVNLEKMSEYILFLGSSNNISEYLQSADYFIFPSESEAFGISLLEALSCELPAIATKTGGIVDIVVNGQNGVTIEVNDEQAMLEQIYRFLKNDSCVSQMGKEGRKLVESQYSIEYTAEMHLSTFNELIRK